LRPVLSLAAMISPSNDPRRRYRDAAPAAKPTGSNLPTSGADGKDQKLQGAAGQEEQADDQQLLKACHRIAAAHDPLPSLPFGMAVVSSNLISAGFRGMFLLFHRERRDLRDGRSAC